MSGRYKFLARAALARQQILAPAIILLMWPPCAAHASTSVPGLHSGVGAIEGGSLLALVLALLMLFVLAGPARAQTSREADGWMEPRTLVEALAGEEAPVLIDVREPDEFVGPLGHVKGAINAPLASVTANPGQLSAYRDRLIALICRTDRRASAAAFALRMSGFRNVVVIRGGMTQWNAYGLPVER